jgi:hypothetical protein
MWDKATKAASSSATIASGFPFTTCRREGFSTAQIDINS